MTWSVEWDDRARRELRRLDQPIQQRLLRFTGQRLVGSEDPRRLGKALRGNLAGLWRYRVGGYRLLCQIQDERLIILVVSVGDRKAIYR